MEKKKNLNKQIQWRIIFWVEGRVDNKPEKPDDDGQPQKIRIRMKDRT